MRFLHCMIRVGDLDRSLRFYVNLLGLRVVRRESYPEGRFTLVFVGVEETADAPLIELTHNWDQHSYEHGSAFGHVALAVPNLSEVCARLEREGVKVRRAPGPMRYQSPDRAVPEVFAFIEDPDGYAIELIQTSPWQPET